MGALKKLFIVIGVLAVAFFGYGFTLPASSHVERTAVIAADKNVIFALVGDHELSQQWSPWAAKDPNMQVTYENGTSGINATMHWQSEHSEVGSGSSKFIGYIPGEKVIMQLDFGDLMATTAAITLKRVNNGTEVVWAFDASHGSILSRYFGLLTESLVGPEFEKGLVNLKKLAESQH